MAVWAGAALMVERDGPCRKHPLSCRVRVNEDESIEIDYTDSGMKFPYRSGGIADSVNVKILEAIVEDGPILRAADLKALIYGMIKGQAKLQKEIGGEIHLGELTSKGYAPISLLFETGDCANRERR